MSVSMSVTAIEGRKKEYQVIIIGAGQAGLSMAYCLKKKGIDYLIIEQSDCVAHNWRHERWDEFCLVTPNWQCQLPGFPYQGNDPDGFMVKDEIVDYLQSYYESFLPPIEFNTRVESLNKEGEKFIVSTSHTRYFCDEVVIACGSYHKPYILPMAEQMPATVQHIHSRDYKNAEALPEGEIMVVGTGQSGCQIAEDLHLQGRQVHLCVGAAPRVSRRYRGRDVVNWLDDMGYYQTTIETHPDGENAPHATNHYVTGRDGGRDLNLRIFAEQGMKLYGKLDTVDKGQVSFSDDLIANLDNADAVADRINESIESYLQKNNIDAPEDSNVRSDFVPESPKTLDMNIENITCVVWATGFKTQFDWIKLPIFDERGRAKQKRGVTEVEGLYFLGLNWMHTWGSGRFYHVGRDAEFLSGIMTKACALQVVSV